MSELNFLSQLITEPVYLVQDKDEIHKNDTPISSDESIDNILEEPQEIIKPKALKTQGSNLKGLIILVNWVEEEDSEKALLLKILASVKRSLDDVLITHAQNATNEQIEAILAENNHKYVLDFGTSKFVQLANTELYGQVQDGAKKYLKANKLSEIKNDVEKKKALWKALQELF